MAHFKNKMLVCLGDGFEPHSFPSKNPDEWPPGPSDPTKGTIFPTFDHQQQKNYLFPSRNR